MAIQGWTRTITNLLPNNSNLVNPSNGNLSLCRSDQQKISCCHLMGKDRSPIHVCFKRGLTATSFYVSKERGLIARLQCQDIPQAVVSTAQQSAGLIAWGRLLIISAQVCTHSSIAQQKRSLLTIPAKIKSNGNLKLSLFIYK